ncbi:VanZ family protein [Rhizobium sp. SG2393]|uniref:VanZ family protein n=1 Tax=Rhizobium sp. SG2393 TaxID=3276279 RepID=UPI00366B2C08
MKNAPYQIAVWTALAAIVFVTVSPIQMRPGDIFAVDVDRALAFGLLAAGFMIAYPRHALKVGLLVVLAASATEALQLLSPTRHARIDDALVKTAGAAAGMAFAYAYNALRAMRHATRATRRPPLRVVSDIPAVEGMTALPVQSRLIEAVYFSPEDGKLRVRLHSGEQRLFEGVSLGDVEALVNAPSPGKHYVEEVRTKFRRLAA